MEDFLYDEFYAVERTHWWFAGMRGIFDVLLGGSMERVEEPELLDVGCGTGIVLEEFSRHGTICGLDLAYRAVKFAKRRNPDAAVIQGNLLHLPIASNCVDAVLVLDVLEHIDDESAALKEIRRVLRPNGIALLNVPAFASLWSEKDTVNHHRRRYSKSTLSRALEISGLQVERITYTNATLFPAIWCTRQFQKLARLRWNPKAEFHPGRWVNWALLRLLSLERRVLRRFNFPFGTSVTCVARRIPDGARSAPLL